MKAYVVLPGHDYEGYSGPSGIYSSKDKAVEAVKTLLAATDWPPDDFSVFEIEMDAHNGKYGHLTKPVYTWKLRP